MPVTVPGTRPSQIQLKFKPGLASLSVNHDNNWQPLSIINGSPVSSVARSGGMSKTRDKAGSEAVAGPGPRRAGPPCWPEKSLCIAKFAEFLRARRIAWQAWESGRMRFGFTAELQIAVYIMGILTVSFAYKVAWRDR
jgi:hypothetical protein